ncbi:Ribonuclease/ribotoxin [Talaromyces proteolyticus]|uniref:Ribonuclease/ribotoxin n=1 Tax=Talaromyces proteolyticus TaxID=1131652 RepID=A0AAD4PU07_9EURO|nr:Ribonuclease/ribotoxin [Talaromyces proteolyticus]KAH8691610.1 Ribonuclease/ribotoxin [Talaromyces proteolyticus]
MVNVKSLLFLAFAASAIAAPIDSEITEADVAQADTTPLEVSSTLLDTSYHCKKSTDKAKTNNSGALIADISKKKAMESAKYAGATNGGTLSGYPKVFENKGGLQFAKPCNKKGHTVYEFPIVIGQKSNYPKDSKKGNTNPGPIRVYYDQYLNFCGIGTKPNNDNSGAPHLCKAALL